MTVNRQMSDIISAKSDLSSTLGIVSLSSSVGPVVLLQQSVSVNW
uniref:Uncharacterized protein n=1 Tax=Anguilla anguilla TaxID=7936 RepID=A0A0E9XBT9_ANGAN